MATVTIWSAKEYIELPPREDGLKDELIEGEIVLSPSAKPLHAKIVRRLLKLLEPIESRGYDLATDFGCMLGEYSLPGPGETEVRMGGDLTFAGLVTIATAAIFERL
jgi:hypothetical protein